MENGGAGCCEYGKMADMYRARSVGVVGSIAVTVRVEVSMATASQPEEYTKRSQSFALGMESSARIRSLVLLDGRTC